MKKLLMCVVLMLFSLTALASEQWSGEYTVAFDDGIMTLSQDGNLLHESPYTEIKLLWGTKLISLDDNGPVKSMFIKNGKLTVVTEDASAALTLSGYGDYTFCDMYFPLYTGRWADSETGYTMTVANGRYEVFDKGYASVYACEDAHLAYRDGNITRVYLLNPFDPEESVFSLMCENENGNLLAVSSESPYRFALEPVNPTPYINTDPSIFMCYKPVIYLYPEAETEVTVKLDGANLTCTYPLYSDGWKVTAKPDGTLTAGGKEYYCLYWEGTTDAAYDFSEGFCVKGEDTASFLEDSLLKLGLTRREANEFIIYWLPVMQDNPYNLISFQTAAYTSAARLDITPAPDTVIRVFMAFKPLAEPVSIAPQQLVTPARSGFTAVEWGGTIAE